MLRNLSVTKKMEFYEKHLNTTRKVLIEKSKQDGFITGFTDNYIKISAPSSIAKINEIEDLKLNSLDNKGMVLVEVPG